MRTQLYGESAPAVRTGLAFGKQRKPFEAHGYRVAPPSAPSKTPSPQTPVYHPQPLQIQPLEPNRPPLNSPTRNPFPPEAGSTHSVFLGKPLGESSHAPKGTSFMPKPDPFDREREDRQRRERRWAKEVGGLEFRMGPATSLSHPPPLPTPETPHRPTAPSKPPEVRVLEPDDFSVKGSFGSPDYQNSILRSLRD